MTKTCLICKKEYTTINPKARYCSHICRDNSQRTSVSVVCLVCKKEFSVWPARIKEGKGKLCSIKCAYKNRKGKVSHMKGKHHTAESIEKQRVQLIGRKASKSQRIKMSLSMKKTMAKKYPTRAEKRNREDIDYRLWRESVFKKDNYSCVECGKSGVYLHADHIEEWAKNIEKRLDVSNGRTLCVPCHFLKTFNKIMPIDSNWGHSNYLIIQGRS